MIPVPKEGEDENEVGVPFSGFTYGLPGGQDEDGNEVFELRPDVAVPMTEEQQRMNDANLILQYGDPKDDKIPLRFIVGREEANKTPGSGPGEKDKTGGTARIALKTDLGTRKNPGKWKDLLEFSLSYNWRHILADDFIGDYKHREAMPFTMIDHTVGPVGNNLEWKTPIHYILGMLYSGTPEYAEQFSLDSRKTAGTEYEDEENLTPEEQQTKKSSNKSSKKSVQSEDETVNLSSGFYGNPKTAQDEHYSNVRSGKVPLDRNFASKIKMFMIKAYLAKFTQNPIARRALLLTEDAVISKRGGNKGILDVDVYRIVRDWIKENPKAVYKGQDDQGNPIVEFEYEEFPDITSAEELNVDFDSTLPRIVNVPISLTEKYEAIPGFSLETMDIEEYDCIVYLVTGARNIDLGFLVKSFGNPRFVRRNHYALERIADNKHEGVMVAIQKNAVSQSSEYLLFSGKIQAMSSGEESDNKSKKSNNKEADDKSKKETEEEKESEVLHEIRIDLFVQEFERGFSLFIMAHVQDNAVLDLLKQLTK